jgi:O-antigen/teichoic acid export membrane protein
LLYLPLMRVIFGVAYAPGAIVLGILMISILVDFPNLILSNAIFVKNLQKKFIIVTGVGVAANILLNFYLIPRYGAVGAAISTVISQLFIMIINWQLLKRFFAFSVVPKLGKIIFATFIMGVVVFFCNVIGVYFFITIAVAMAGYAAILYVLKEPLVTEILSLIK